MTPSRSEARHAGEPQPAHTALQHRRRVARRDAAGARVERIGTLHQVVQQGGIHYGARHRSRSVEGRAERQYPVGADPADRRLEAGQAAPRRRQPHRATGIGADRPGREPSGDRHPRAAARPAGGASNRGVPRVPRRAAVLVGAPAAHRELDRMRLADHDQPGGDQAPGERGGTGRPPLAPNLRAAGRNPPLDLDQILERDRYAVQRADTMSRSDRLVGRLSGEPRLLGVHLDKGMELCIRRLDPRERGIDDIDRREPTGIDFGRHDMGRQQGRIGVDATAWLPLPGGWLRQHRPGRAAGVNRWTSSADCGASRWSKPCGCGAPCDAFRSAPCWVRRR